ncbi:hypothetical protein PLICRDRAFT_286514 [Plicaturopsis crispa FD-325 SS-3]|nr:hypothetical protein PLICRDRAFT_286514 [Plicaturopsis crispa FD-325 SS-3]
MSHRIRPRSEAFHIPLSLSATSTFDGMPQSPGMRSPGPSPVDIQNHLYLSFLSGSTADVALRVHSVHWSALYRLHRVVLIQSGFFRGLFTSGFVESSPKARGWTGLDEIDVVFDDPNITRATFELCVARLYGGGPPLHISPLLIPTSTHPLTRSFPPSSSANPNAAAPPGYQAGTPTFLLSLLATAVYLSIPSVASLALNSILGSIGPWTVVAYLDFAMGKPVKVDGGGSDAAVGLEEVAAKLEEGTQSTRGSSRRSKARKLDKQEEEIESVAQTLDDLSLKKEAPSECSSDSSFEDADDGDCQPACHYGTVSDKIGEACACWLARWGPDMLSYEDLSYFKNSPPGSTGTSQQRRRQKAHSVPMLNTSPATIYSPVPAIWRRNGLSIDWVRALIGSDALFVKDERARYEFAKGVSELRRREGLDDKEEEQWEGIFKEAIYYANISTEDLIAISKDISPSTGRPFVPLSVLQAAQWNQSLLRHRITAKPSSSPPSSPSPGREKELGLSSTVSEISGDDQVYYPVPNDSSLRLGDNGGIEGATMDELFDNTACIDPKKRPTTCARASNFFGLQSERRVLPADADEVAKEPQQRWSPYPPFRFAVEFWDVDALREKNRLHSHTVWYAGSLFNVYVQVVRKKGVQLGVYLHRQSSVDPIPPSSAPHPLLAPRHSNHGSPLSSPSHMRVPSLPSIGAGMGMSTSPPSTGPMHYSPSIHPPTRSTTPLPVGSTPPPAHVLPAVAAASIPATAPPVMPPQPYRDSRPEVAAHFTISCASATGAALTRFTSAPDVFRVSQSWGWKSSSLRTEEYIDVDNVEDSVPAANVTPAGREVSLRATIVLGIV